MKRKYIIYVMACLPSFFFGINFFGVANADVYKCTNDRQLVTYQDRPCTDGSDKSERKLEDRKNQSIPSAAEKERKFNDGVWQITSQKQVGVPLSSREPPQTNSKCIRQGTLEKMAKDYAQMSSLFGGGSWCREISGSVTAVGWRGYYKCEKPEVSIEIQYEFIFYDETMKGTFDATGMINGKPARELHSVSGKRLGPC